MYIHLELCKSTNYMFSIHLYNHVCSLNSLWIPVSSHLALLLTVFFRPRPGGLLPLALPLNSPPGNTAASQLQLHIPSYLLRGPAEASPLTQHQPAGFRQPPAQGDWRCGTGMALDTVSSSWATCAYNVTARVLTALSWVNVTWSFGSYNTRPVVKTFQLVHGILVKHPWQGSLSVWPELPASWQTCLLPICAQSLLPLSTQNRQQFFPPMEQCRVC